MGIPGEHGIELAAQLLRLERPLVEGGYQGVNLWPFLAVSESRGFGGGILRECLQRGRAAEEQAGEGQSEA